MALDQPEEPKKDFDKSEMSFFDHIDELRKHIIRSVVAVLVLAVVSFLNKHIIFDEILFGPVKTDFWTYQKMCELSHRFMGNDSYCIQDIGFVLSNINMTGQFTQHLYISLISGMILAFPYILWQLWLFIRPALTSKERKYASGLVGASSLLFFIGILFGYYLLTPLSVNFLGSYKVSNLVSNEINLESYVSFISTMTLACGLVFEMPILVYFLAKIGILGSGWMRKNRKYAVIIILIAAGILTPSPDIASQLLMFIPFYGLFELSILVAMSVEKKKK